MYQGIQTQPQAYNSGNYYQNTNPYGNQYQQRYPAVESVPGSYSMTPQGTYLKGRPVASIEEARAALIDLDGSLYVFTDIGNKKIYTKQINLDGTATLNTYSLVVDDPTTNANLEYVTKIEFNQALNSIQNMFNNLTLNQQPLQQPQQQLPQKEEEVKKTTLNSF